VKFNSLNFELFSLNINPFPTLQSLAFGIFRFKYLKDYKIPLITGQFYHDLKISYTGGATDVYKPNGKKIKGYDVYSIFTSQMKICSMPVGNITYFEGDITKIDPKAFDFFEVKIYS
jgi:hypothetical protein